MGMGKDATFIQLNSQSFCRPASKACVSSFGIGSVCNRFQLFVSGVHGMVGHWFLPMEVKSVRGVCR